MIVIGILAPAPAGNAASVAEIARRAAATGARTEVIGVAPAGPIGDRQLAQLATVSAGHATVIRSDASGIEPADIELALRYLPDIRVIVLTAPAAPLLATALAAASWSGAQLVVIGPLEADATAAITPGSAGSGGTPIVLDPPARDPDGAFAGVVATLAARLDAGEDPTTAWRTTVAALALDPA